MSWPSPLEFRRHSGKCWVTSSDNEGSGQRTTAAELARARGLRRQSVQETVNRLANKGLLLRALNPLDRRAPVLELTSAARQALEVVEVRRTQWAAQIKASLGEQKITELLQQVASLQSTLNVVQTADSAAPSQAKVAEPEAI
ncbi:MarR family winged helix-turn-helix transcriptional regulator [Renibacterium salmoninarum]|uniref:MarR family winged helix-turn-helix transcriptional regulator n=1 Tax=Renibacterium salmoninarum TaxID=1646 RepID=UPI002D781E4D|nr:MarR family winged helix-turn-helix transcriptional regulator [Renibacterium salmoninarum]